MPLQGSLAQDGPGARPFPGRRVCDTKSLDRCPVIRCPFIGRRRAACRPLSCLSERPRSDAGTWPTQSLTNLCSCTRQGGPPLVARQGAASAPTAVFRKVRAPCTVRWTSTRWDVVGVHHGQDAGKSDATVPHRPPHPCCAARDEGFFPLATVVVMLGLVIPPNRGAVLGHLTIY